MKSSVKRYLLSAVLMITACTVSAYEFEVDGIYYSKYQYAMDSEDNYPVEVVDNGNQGTYTGDIVIPKSVYYDGYNHDVVAFSEDAFMGCGGVTSVTVADTPISGFGTFRWCYQLKAFHVRLPEYQSSFSYLKSVDGVLMTADESQLVAYPRGRQGNLQIPASTTDLSSLDLDGCPIDTLTLSPAQTTYDDGFSVMLSAKVLVFPEGVTTIGRQAFSWTGETIMLPSTIISVGESAFGCYEYPQAVVCLATTPPAIADNAFGSQPSSFGSTLYVPVGSEQLYSETEGWSGFTKIAGMLLDAPDTYHVAEAGGLSSVLPDVSGLKSAITLTGQMNGTDFIYLRSLFQDGSKLERLDLSGVQIVSGGDTYYQWYHTQDNTITPYLFREFKTLRELILPQTVESIGDYGFGYAPNLEKLTMGNGVKTIGVYACSLPNLKEVVWGASLEKIDDCAFHSAYALQTLAVPEGVKEIGVAAFVYCEELTEVSLPNSLTSIGANAFSTCKKLKVLSLPSSIKELPNSICTGCESLATLHIPAGMALPRFPFCFAGCKSLTSFTVDSSHPLYTVIDGAIYTRDKKKLVLWPTAKGSGATISIPEGTEELGTGSLYDCYAKEVTFPTTLRVVEEAAFQESSVEHISFPHSVESIGRIAFHSCKELETLTLPNSLTEIPEQMCQMCKNLTEISIPASVTSIGFKAFQNCDNLATVTVAREEPLSINSSWNPFPSRSNITLSVPANSKSAYEAADYWKEFKEIIEQESATPKCATPTIAFDKGNVVLSCETEGVEYAYEVSAVGKSTSGRLSPYKTYKLRFYATKDGYEDSDVVTKEITVDETFIAQKGDLNGDGKVDIVDVTTLIDMILGK